MHIPLPRVKPEIEFSLVALRTTSPIDEWLNHFTRVDMTGGFARCESDSPEIEPHLHPLENVVQVFGIVTDLITASAEALGYGLKIHLIDNVLLVSNPREARMGV